MTIEQHNFKMEDNNCKLIIGLFNRTVNLFQDEARAENTLESQQLSEAVFIATIE